MSIPRIHIAHFLRLAAVLNVHLSGLEGDLFGKGAQVRAATGNADCAGERRLTDQL
jgi:hypothetical protein